MMAGAATSQRTAAVPAKAPGAARLSRATTYLSHAPNLLRVYYPSNDDSPVAYPVPLPGI